MNAGVRLLLAAISGLMVYGSFEPLGFSPLGWLGMGLFYLSLCPWPGIKKGANQGQKFQRVSLSLGALLGLVHGLALYLLMLPWIGEYVGSLPYVALAITEALYCIAAGALGAALVRWRFGFAAWPWWIVAVEWLRSTWPFHGFAWGRIAWGQVNGVLSGLMPVGGPALVTFATALLGSSLVTLVFFELPAIIAARRSRRTTPFTPRSVTAVLTIAALVAVGAGGPTWFGHKNAPDTGEVTVAAIQGNVPRMGLDFNAQRRAVLANHVRETEALDQPVDLVVWPENSSDVNPFADPMARSMIEQAVNAVQAPVLVGTLTRDEAGQHNTMVVFDPNSGQGEWHHKKYLQPFGEYMPYRAFFRKFSSYVDQAGDFKPGDGNGVVHMQAAHSGDVVAMGVSTCYEVAFDASARDAVRAGAQILSTPTNNATFGFTDMTYQQLAMSRMRAKETNRAVVVAATSGSSAMITPEGKVLEKTRIFTADRLVYSLPLRDTTTFAVKHGSSIEWALVIIGTFMALAAALTTRRTPGASASSPRRAPKSGRLRPRGQRRS